RLGIKNPSLSMQSRNGADKVRRGKPAAVTNDKLCNRLPIRRPSGFFLRGYQRVDGYCFAIEAVWPRRRIDIGGVSCSSRVPECDDFANHIRIQKRTIACHPHGYIGLGLQGCVRESGKNIRLAATKAPDVVLFAPLVDYVISCTARSCD